MTEFEQIKQRLEKVVEEYDSLKEQRERLRGLIKEIYELKESLRKVCDHKNAYVCGEYYDAGDQRNYDVINCPDCNYGWHERIHSHKYPNKIKELKGDNKYE